MKFTLEIRLGNDAMQTLAEVGDALRRSKKSLADGHEPLEAGDRDNLYDTNGNHVGSWKVEP